MEFKQGDRICIKKGVPKGARTYAGVVFPVGSKGTFKRMLTIQNPDLAEIAFDGWKEKKYIRLKHIERYFKSKVERILSEIGYE